MSQNVTWPPIGGTSYPIPNTTGEVNWTSLTNYLVALSNAQSTTNQKVGVRVATSTPIAVAAATDYMVVSNLTVPGAVVVNLPAAQVGQVFVIKDGKGDALTNNITINRNGTDTIDGATSLVLNMNFASVTLSCTTAGVWNVSGNNITGATQTIAGGKTFTNSATFNGNITWDAAFIYTATSPQIRSNKADGADTTRLYLAGGGAGGDGTRGGNIVLYGNEFGSSIGGQLNYIAGDSADAANTNKAHRWFGSSSTGGAFTETMYLTGAGALTANNIHNVGAGNITSGTYTPTATAGTNVSGASTLSARYSRVGNVVTVSGQMAVTCTAAANTESRIQITLPISSNLGAGRDCVGVCVQMSNGGTAAGGGIIQGDPSTDRAELVFNSTQTSSANLSFHFQYTVI